MIGISGTHRYMSSGYGAMQIFRQPEQIGTLLAIFSLFMHVCCPSFRSLHTIESLNDAAKAPVNRVDLPETCTYMGEGRIQ
jgi:hypothetical protein